MQDEKPCPLVSSCFLMFFNLANHYQVPTWQPSSKLGSQVQTWQSLHAEQQKPSLNLAVATCGTAESKPSQKNLAAKYKLGSQVQTWQTFAKVVTCLPSLNLALGTNLAAQLGLNITQVVYLYYKLSTVIYAC